MRVIERSWAHLRIQRRLARAQSVLAAGAIGALSVAVAACGGGTPTSPATVTEWPVSFEPQGLTAGPDRSVWLTGPGSGKIVKVNSAGKMTDFPLPPPLGGAMAITTGEGDLWFTVGASVGRMSPAGVVTVYKLTTQPATDHIAVGPDESIWFSTARGIAKITTSGKDTEYPDYGLPDPASGLVTGVTGLTVARDGSVWFTERQTGYVATMTPSGTLTKFRVPKPGGQPGEIVAGPDGNLWFVDVGSSFAGTPQVFRVTPSGSFTEYAIPRDRGQFVDYPLGITVGADKSLWLTGQNQDRVVRVTTSGGFSEYTFTEFPRNGTMSGGEIASGPDGNLWMTVNKTVVRIAVRR